MRINVLPRIQNQDVWRHRLQSLQIAGCVRNNDILRQMGIPEEYLTNTFGQYRIGVRYCNRLPKRRSNATIFGGVFQFKLHNVQGFTPPQISRFDHGTFKTVVGPAPDRSQHFSRASCHSPITLRSSYWIFRRASESIGIYSCRRHSPVSTVRTRSRNERERRGTLGEQLRSDA